MTVTKTTRALKSRKNELTKSYYVWVDGVNTIIYEAPADAADNAPCLKTIYEYDEDDNVVKSLEEEAVWDSDWDI